MNDPVDSYNGEMAFWVNGEKIIHLGEGFPEGRWFSGTFITPRIRDGEPFEGFHWRSVPELNINYVWLSHYVDTDPSCSIWLDDVIVATSYIGPMVDQTPHQLPGGKAVLPGPLGIDATARPGGRMAFNVNLQEAGPFTVEVLDVAGKRLWSAEGRGARAGIHQVAWDGSERTNSSALYLVVARQGRRSVCTRAVCIP